MLCPPFNIPAAYFEGIDNICPIILKTCTDPKFGRIKAGHRSDLSTPPIGEESLVGGKKGRGLTVKRRSGASNDFELTSDDLFDRNHYHCHLCFYGCSQTEVISQ